MQKIDQTFIDDPLRVMRGIRIACKLNFTISPPTYEALKMNSYRLSIITKERIADELNKMLLCKDPVCAMKLLKDIGAMKYVIPELEYTYNLMQNKYHGFNTVWQHTMKVLDNIVNNCMFAGGFDKEQLLILRMSALLHDVGKIKTHSIDDKGDAHFYMHELVSVDLCDTILKRLKYSNDFIGMVRFLVGNHMRTKNWGDDCSHMKDKSLRKLQYDCSTTTRYSMLLSLIDADNKAHDTEYCLPNQCFNIDYRVCEMIEENTDMFGYRLPIDGNDVMAIKGLKPGREVKECLDYALKLAFNNPKISKEELLKHIKGYKIKTK